MPTAPLALKLGLEESQGRAIRHKLQQRIETKLPKHKLRDRVVEADEMYQNAGEKGQQHSDPTDPPRRRAKKVRGHGTWDTDRPPVASVVGRTSGQIRLQVWRHSERKTLQAFVEVTPRKGCTANTDEWAAYQQLPPTGRRLQQVCHTPGYREWARDAIREGHANTMEGL